MSGRILAFARPAIVIAITTFALFEIALRVSHHFYPLPVLHSDSYNQFRGIPHSSLFGFKLNSHGFMDVEFQVAKEPGTFRILGLGDSFAFGVVPYQHNYLTLLTPASPQAAAPASPRSAD